jgi:pSer/pThr/pTyr-binding forkhead associated (FHA) protein
VLVTDEGAVYTVSTDYVIGRDPEHAPDVVAGRARALVLQDAENSTSRVHARLHLAGWEVLVTDSGSANGTFVSSGGPAGPWTAVHREPGTPLRPGDRIRLGKRQLLLDRYHLPASRLQTRGKEGSGGPRR